MGRNPMETSKILLKIFGASVLIPFMVSSLVIIDANNESLNASVNNSSYWKLREQLVTEDYSFILGNDLVLSDEEEWLNEKLMSLKEAEMQRYISNLGYLPAMSFFQARDAIDESKVFEIIKQMPKGAVLHSHDLALASLEWVISELTYWDDLYICQNSQNLTLFRFFNEPDSTCDWRLVKEERANYTSQVEYDEYLHSQLSIFTSNPIRDYPDINTVWTRMENSFVSLIGLVTYAPAWVSYLEQAMKEFMEDNVVYLEFRGVLSLLYEKDGKVYTEMETLEVYDKVISNFSQTFKEDYYGTRFIYAPLKNDDISKIWDYAELVKKMRRKYPSLVAGFDLVGQEDVSQTLKNYVEPLLDLLNDSISVPLFFHAGETDWYGVDSDENLFDAILLNATRIGHGYAITKHPTLVNIVKESNIPLEVCPISNQVLMLLKDLRNHPMIEVVSRGIDIVVSSDDPAVWGADPLSHDFYEAFHVLGGAKGDLRLLKKLALNSIRYSSLESKQKQELHALWQKKWDTFVMYHFSGSENGNSTHETI